MKTTPRQKQLIKQFHAIIGSGEYCQIVKDAIKEDYGVESLKQLTEEDLQNIVEGLEEQIKHTQKNKTLKKLRSKVLAIATSTYYPELKEGDYERFNKFMLHKSTCKKPLAQYNLKELQKLIAQFKAIKRTTNVKKRLLKVCLN